MQLKRDMFSFNRTFMELKFFMILTSPLFLARFNRTFMELK